MSDTKENEQSPNLGGRPTLYRKEYNDQAYKLCLLGATDKQLADFFDVSEDTIYEWKNVHPKFSESLRAGKLVADSNVAEKLYHRALGYSHPETHVSNYQGQITLTELTKHYPPDTAAAIIWLKNRQPDKWRERHEVTGADGKDLIPRRAAQDLTDDELAAIISDRSGAGIIDSPTSSD